LASQHAFHNTCQCGRKYRDDQPGSSEANISLVVDEAHLDKAVKAIKAEFKNGIIKRSRPTGTFQ